MSAQQRRHLQRSGHVLDGVLESYESVPTPHLLVQRPHVFAEPAGRLKRLNNPNPNPNPNTKIIKRPSLQFETDVFWCEKHPHSRLNTYNLPLRCPATNTTSTCLRQSNSMCSMLMFFHRVVFQSSKLAFTM